MSVIFHIKILFNLRKSKGVDNKFKSEEDDMLIQSHINGKQNVRGWNIVASENVDKILINLRVENVEIVPTIKQIKLSSEIRSVKISPVVKKIKLISPNSRLELQYLGNTLRISPTWERIVVNPVIKGKKWTSVIIQKRLI